MLEPPPAPRNPSAYDAAFPGQFAHQFNIVQNQAQILLNHIGPNGDGFIQTLWHAPDYNAIELLQLQRLGLVDRGDTHGQRLMPQDPSRTISLDERQSSMLQQHRERTRDGHGPNKTAHPSFARPNLVCNPHTDQPRPQAENISVPPVSSVAMPPPPPTKISLSKAENEALPFQRPNRNQSSAQEAIINMATQQSRPAALAPPIWCEENLVKFLHSQNARPPNSQHRQNRPPAESALPQHERQKPPPNVAHTRLLFSEHLRQHPPQALRLKEALRQPDLVGPNTAKIIQNSRTQSGLYQSPSPEPASPPRRFAKGMMSVPGYAQPATQHSLSQQGRRPPGMKAVPGTQKEALVGPDSPYAEVDLSPHMTALSMSPNRQAQPYQPAQGAPILIGALHYLNQIKVQFAYQPGVYKRFLDIMRAFKSDTISKPAVLNRVAELFADHPDLIEGFGVFLPAPRQPPRGYFSKALPSRPLYRPQNADDVDNNGASNTTAILPDNVRQKSPDKMGERKLWKRKPRCPEEAKVFDADVGEVEKDGWGRPLWRDPHGSRKKQDIPFDKEESGAGSGEVEKDGWGRPIWRNPDGSR